MADVKLLVLYSNTWNHLIASKQMCSGLFKCYLQTIRLHKCDNRLLADPDYLNQPNYSWPLESCSGFSHLWPGVFHIPLPTHKIRNREGGRKKEQSRYWVSSKRKKGEVGDTFVHSVFLWVNASVYSSETPTSH